MLQISFIILFRISPKIPSLLFIIYYYQFYQEGRHTQKAKPVQGASPIVNYTIQTKQTKKTKTHTKTIN